MVKIEIVPDLEKRMKDDNEYVKDVLAGRRKIDKARAEHTVVVTPEIFAKMFSPQRIKLLLELRNSGSRNIYQLAKRLGRSYETVHRDVTYLAGLGIIKIKSSDRKKYPSLEPFQIPIFAKA